VTEQAQTATPPFGLQAAEQPPADRVNEQPPVDPVKKRVASIDALRGFDMFWIIGGVAVVESFLKIFADPLPESVRYHFSHPAWEGFSAWDMIMPLFLFIVGVVMPFSFSRRLEAGATKRQLYRKILVRTLVLFVLGMAAQGHLLDFDLSKLHIYCNTLQAIAAGYLVAGILLLNVRVWVQLLAIPALLVGYWALMMFVPFGGHAAGTLEPKANLARYIDFAILGPFQDGTTYTWILSSMGFAATVLLGVMAGHILRSRLKPNGKWIALAGVGFLLLVLGYLWGWHPSRFRFPVIKHIWSSSMVLWSAGWSYLLLSFFYLIIDVLGYKRWAFFFIVIGANAIFVYMATRLFDFHLIGDVFVHGIVPHIGRLGPFLRHSAALAVIWIILYYLYRNRTFIKV